MAAEAGHTATLELLISAGAEPASHGGDCRAPCLQVRLTGHARCAAVLHIAALLEDSSEEVHAGIICDRSGVSPIVGPRYTLEDEDYDLCEAEYLKLEPSERSKYTRLEGIVCGMWLTPNELAAAAEPGVLEVALPSAFARWPLAALERIAQLVVCFRAEAVRVAALDAECGEQLRATVLRGQQIAVGLLRALPPSELQRALLTTHGSAALEALVLAQCHVVIAEAAVQRALDTQWRIVTPRGWADGAIILRNSLWKLAVVACFPPYERRLAQERKASMAEARRRVEEANMEPERDLQANKLTYFHVEERPVTS
eukprot:7013005-Prymnesium_polylepis.1